MMATAVAKTPSKPTVKNPKKISAAVVSDPIADMLTRIRNSNAARHAEVKVPAGEWHMLKIKMTGDHIECFLDGKKYLEHKDATFTDVAMIGLWSKADAQTLFDDLTLISSMSE